MSNYGKKHIVNTHYHSDHVGSNGLIQEKYGTPIAAHWWEASIINRRDREACSAEWLRQPLVPYRVEASLTDGYEIDTGDCVVKVLETPGHTQGHISLYVEKSMELISGDFLLASDVGWINIFREGINAIENAIKSLERVSRLPLKKVYPGHGPVINSPTVQIDNARRKYEKWLKALRS